MERDTLNHIQFVHFGTHIHASAHKRLRVKKKKEFRLDVVKGLCPHIKVFYTI